MLGPVTAQVSVPVGVPLGPVTVAVKTKVPPVTTPAALSVTAVVEVLSAPAGAASRPSETTQVTVPMKATSQGSFPCPCLPSNSQTGAPTPNESHEGKVPVEIEHASYSQTDRCRQCA